MLYILLLHFVYHLSPFIRMSAPWRQRFGLFCSLLCLDQCFIHSRCSTNICWIYELINKLHRHTGRKQFPIKDIDQMAFRFCCNFESHKTVRQYLWNFERKSLWFKTTLFSAKLFICEDKSVSFMSSSKNTKTKQIESLKIYSTLMGTQEWVNPHIKSG